MRLARTRRVVAAACFLAVPFAGRVAFGVETAKPGDAGTAQAHQLVAAAMQAEVDGCNAQRQQLLIQALELKPDMTSARWQSGYVSVNGDWQSVDNAGKAAPSNRARKGYVDLRAKMPDDAAGDARLARWCQDHRLTDEARAHWNRVIALDPNNAEARAKLGFRQFNGLWLTDNAIKEVRAYETRLRDEDTLWRARLLNLRAKLTHRQKSVREAAAKELLSITDPDSAVALERYLAGTSEQIDSLLVKLLGTFETRDATLILTRCAVISPWLEVRKLAAQQLHQREVDTYAPPLLAALYKPNAQHMVVQTADGGVALRQVVSTERQYGISQQARDTVKYAASPASAPIPTLPDPTTLVDPQTLAVIGTMQKSIADAMQVAKANGATTVRLPTGLIPGTGINSGLTIAINPKQLINIWQSDAGVWSAPPPKSPSWNPAVGPVVVDAISQGADRYNARQLQRFLPEIKQQVTAQMQLQQYQKQVYAPIEQVQQQQRQQQIEQQLRLLQLNAMLRGLYLAQQAAVLDGQATLTEMQIRIEAQKLNERIVAALNVATGQDLPVDASLWWQWWDNYTCLKSAEKPVGYGYSRTVSIKQIGLAATDSALPGKPASTGSTQSPPTPPKFAPISIMPITPDNFVTITYCSCFAAGTPVATINGPRPVESIRVGDLVLSQDAKTGELAYKPVLGTSVGPPTQLRNLSVGDESIECTRNHLFWTNGTGWVPAHELAEGSCLHSVRGAVPVWKVTAVDKAKTYNMVVADFSTYFVGQQKLLVHDNSMWEPAESLVPGMAASLKLAVK